jgi:type II secretory pathway component PulC
MKVLTLMVVMTSSAAALDRQAVAKLLQLSLRDDPAPPVHAWRSITLLGTLVDRAQLCSAAFVDDGRHGRTLYLGDELHGATVVGIERDRLTLDRDGVLEEVSSHPAPVTAAAPAALADGMHIPFVTIQAELPKLATQIRAMPVANGFKIFAIVPDSLFAKAGLKNGDVIHGGLELLQKLKPGPLTVEIERDGRTFSLSGWLD